VSRALWLADADSGSGRGVTSGRAYRAEAGYHLFASRPPAAPYDVKRLKEVRCPILPTSRSCSICCFPA